MVARDAVIVQIGGDEIPLLKSTTRAGKILSVFARGAGTALKPFDSALSKTISSVFSMRGAIATLAGTGGLGLLVNRSIATADAIAKTSDRIGLGVEAYQELKFVARETGVELALLNTATTALVRRSGEAISGNKTFTKSFEDLGITVEELRRMKPDQLLGRVADEVNKLGSQSEQIAALDKVMSEAGRRMFNFTKLGSEGIAELRKEARAMGLVIDEVMVRDAENAGDQLARVGEILKTNVTRAVLTLTPQIISLSESFTQWLVPAISQLEQLFPATVVSAGELETRIEGLHRQLEKLTGVTRTEQNLDLWLSMEDETQDKILKIVADLAELNDLLEIRTRKETMLREAVQGVGAATVEESDDVKELAESLQFEIDQLGRTSAEQELYNLAKKAGVEVNAEFRESIGPLVKELDAEKAAWADAAEGIKGLQKTEEERARRAEQIYGETRTPFENYQQSIVELNELLNRGAIDWETYNRAVMKSQAALLQAQDETDKMIVSTRDLAGAVTDLGDEALRGNMKTWEDWGNFAIDQIMSVAQSYISSSLQTFGGGLGGFLGGIFGGGGGPAAFQNAGGAISGASPGFVPGMTPRAGGGPVTAGQAYLVGEKKPELFIPGQSGVIVPGAEPRGVGALGGGRTTVNIYNSTGAEAQTQQRQDGAGNTEIDVWLDEKTAANITSGGATLDAIMNVTGATPNPINR